ncbi:MAG: hypothetical protein LAN64_01190 [Acidobacteriia bacterium]|nr:hypothetical protein [Terriglobia bacterium]
MSAVYYNHEGLFFSIDKAMNHPGSTGAFGHRLLFIGVAWLFKLAIPGLSARRYFEMSQVVATIFTFLVMRAWVRNFASEEWEWLSHLLLGLMFVPVMIYHNFHDISVVGFYAACLMLLFRRRFVPYILVYSLGLWNHEVLSMVTGVAVVCLWLEGERKKAIVIGAIQIAIFVLYRLAVEFFLPGDKVVAVGLAQNLRPIATYGFKNLVFAGLKLVLPVAAAALSYRYAPRFLKIALLVQFAALFVGTVLYGRLDESRQWNTMFAIIVPMAVIFVQMIVRGSEPVAAEVDNARERLSEATAD